MTITILKLFFATFFAFIFYYFLDIFSEIFTKKKNLRESFDIFKTFFSSYDNFKKFLSFDEFFLEDINNKNKQYNDNINESIYEYSYYLNLNIKKELTGLSNSFLKRTEVYQSLKTINNTELFDILDNVVSDKIIEFNEEGINIYHSIISNFFAKRKNNKMDLIESEVSNEYENQNTSFSRY